MDSLYLRLSSPPRLIDLHFSNPRSIASHHLSSGSPPFRCPLFIHAPKMSRHFFLFASASSGGAGMLPRPSKSSSAPCLEAPSHLSLLFIHLVTSAVLFACFRARASAIGPSLSLTTTASIPSEIASAEGSSSSAGEVEDEEFRAAFEQWKSKTFALTVPLRIVALRGSVPPSWLKDFVQAQGRRLKMNTELRGSLESIYSELNLAFDKDFVDRKSAMSADLISLGDSWLSIAIQKGLIDPIPNIEEQDWFKSLGNKWKVQLCRNVMGELDPLGNIWGAPYRWGAIVIAYKKSKFKKHNLAPIEDWDDLWRPEITGKISMIDSPREVVGAVLKRMGASYNTKDIDLHVIGGREGVLHNLKSLQKQVRYFDSVNYMKSFGVGDVWVAVGWSSDVIPAAKRMANVAVVIPKSGSSICADLWATPAATKFRTDRIGGRVRGPSPLIHQWIEFCLQTARALPFRQEVISGASPFALEHLPMERIEPVKGKPKLDTNLVDGVPPPEILEKCEFLEPLSEKALDDYKWLVSFMQKPHGSLFRQSK
ncbi:uncharacterized protein LOC110035242 [Phalaenopsis equestris]|uniref:uncharacterized protein LOC110020240 n=1 Tax=Phalaenopsis equestris TaxID=78828 RepID=UPI0009E1F5AD|nr:uncharacterized protein LOC110020240 [Phalaenopsis equestris]XP_020595131.1 uncharacterized protein LOC110035242 [Phalaenopsis equestris]